MEVVRNIEEEFSIELREIFEPSKDRPNLTYLVIGNNLVDLKLQSIEFTNISDILLNERVVGLDLAYNSISKININENINSSLLRLSLIENGITQLDPSINYLKGLTTLWLSKNPISILKNLQLKKLKNLFCEGCELTDFSSILDESNMLHWISFEENHIITVPDNIGNTKLERIYLAYNKISDIPDSLHNLNSLKELRLHNNPIDKLTIDFTVFANLERVTLSKKLGKTMSQSDIEHLKHINCEIIYY